jgi:hypothetical protein
MSFSSGIFSENSDWLSGLQIGQIPVVSKKNFETNAARGGVARYYW